MVGRDELEGVRFLDHTADVGMAVEADSAGRLFHRAALGMLALLRGDDDMADHLSAPAPPNARPANSLAAVSVSGDAPADEGWPAALAGWLRELLFLHGTEGKDYVRAEFHRLDAKGFDATVETAPTTRAIREIKGVTYHELSVEHADGTWQARVIFDV